MQDVLPTQAFYQWRAAQQLIGQSLVDQAFIAAAKKYDAYILCNPVNLNSYANFIRRDVQSKTHLIRERTVREGILDGFIAGQGTELDARTLTFQINESEWLGVLREGQEALVREINPLDTPLLVGCYTDRRFTVSDIDLLFILFKQPSHEVIEDAEYGQLTILEKELICEINCYFNHLVNQYWQIDNPHSDFSLVSHGPSNRFAGSKFSHIHYPIQIYSPEDQGMKLGCEEQKEQSFADLLSFFKEKKEYPAHFNNNWLKHLACCLFLFVGFGRVFASVDWVDIPTGDYRQILGSNNAFDKLSSELSQLASEYHCIAKSSKEHLPLRVEALKTLLDYVNQQPTQNSPSLPLLKMMIEKKVNYLIALLTLPSFEEIAQFHLDASANQSNYTSIILRNNRTYSLKMKETWGEFWLEAIDPCHRRLANYFQFWVDHVSNATDYASFFLWLESQPLPNKLPVVDYFSPKKMDQSHVTIADGYLITNQGNRLTTSQRHLFVIDLAQELFITNRSEEVWHTSLSQGKPVLGAGLIHCENGVVSAICFESGHYLPNLAQSFQAIDILKEKKVHFRQPLEIVYFENRNKYRVFVSLESLDDFNQFFQALHSEKREEISSNEF